MTNGSLDQLDAYDYSLPEELIAQQPLPERDAARLMVIDRQQRQWSHRSIRDLPELLAPGDCLVLNNTRVLPARLRGIRTATGGKWEGLYLDALPTGEWRLIGQTRGHLRPGETLSIPPASLSEEPQTATASEFLTLHLIRREAGGMWVAVPTPAGDPVTLLEQYGAMPLPPYIARGKQSPADKVRYQTVYAEAPGSVAAPTAGLHFTRELLEHCAARGIGVEHVTLHVGLGTFRPVSVTNLAEHRMHSEWCALSADVAARLVAVRQRGHRVIAVGTTSVRTLESAAAATGELREFRGETDIFIRPPYSFRTIDGLLTNFHLPKSTLLMLVSALADRDLILAAYAEAIRERYRFFSYGDAMLLL